MSFKVIGISGKASTGKDYLHTNYIRASGFHRWALADHFKMSIVGRGLATYEEVFVTKPPHVRKLLQEEGTERGRNVWGENVWCLTALSWMRLLNENWGVDKFIVTDIRFPNEVRFVQENGGRVYRIEAPIRAAANSLSAEARQHPSETALDGYTGFDGTIYNDPGDMPDVAIKALFLLHNLI